MKAIETRYKGYRFRSRLEARWAVFFDALEIAWEYEKEGFALPSGPYLPDFYLPEWNVYAEVKPTPEVFDWRQAGELAEATERDVIALIGTPEVRWYCIQRPSYPWEDNDGNAATQPACRDWIDFAYSFHKGRAWFALCPDDPEPEYDPPCDDRCFEKAVQSARSARFEHGESGVKLPVHREVPTEPQKRHRDLHGVMFEWENVVERVAKQGMPDLARLLKCTIPAAVLGDGTVILERDPFETLTPEEERQLATEAPLCIRALSQVFYGTGGVRMKSPEANA